MIRPHVAIAVVLTLAMPGLARAAGAPAEDRVLVGVRAGAGLSSLFGPFGAAFVPKVEAGYRLGKVTLFAAGAYAAPVAEGEIPADPRLPDGQGAHYRLTRQTLTLALGLFYRFPIESSRVAPYLSAAPRLYLTRVLVEGDTSGHPFGENQETATDMGLQVGAGLELTLGPGAALAEVRLAWAALDGVVLRNTQAASLDLLLGYRLRF